MNKKKLTIYAIAWALFLLIAFLIIALQKSDSNSPNNQWWIFKVWIVGDDKDKFNQFFDEFKTIANIKKLTLDVESFDSYEEYNLALVSSIIRWDSPDVFVLNNNEKSVLSENVAGIDPKFINPDDFRTNYKPLFWDDLIISSDDWQWNKVDFVMWIPVWYETLGIFYNRAKEIQSEDFKNWVSVNALVKEQKEKHPDTTPLWIWNGSNTKYSVDIATQFFMLEGIDALDKLNWAKLKSSLYQYMSFWVDENKYNERFSDMKKSWLNDINLFSRWDVSMIIAYPRTIKDIDENGFRKNFLYASPFPSYFQWSGKWFVNYNFFVVNKNSNYKDIWYSLLSYMNSKEWASKYLDLFSYYLPANVTLEDDYMDKKIFDWYNVKLRDFYNENLELSSFDKWIKSVYDKELVKVLDDELDYDSVATIFQKSLSCKTKKILKLEDLSVSCSQE